MRVAIPVDDDPYPCSCPQGGGWRPGARWAQPETVAAGGAFRDDRLPGKDAVEAAIATLPPHRRPAVRELGRRSEAADMPFRAMPADEGGMRPMPLMAAGAGPGRAIATVHRLGSRMAVAACSDAARAAGVEPGMALTQARLIAPQLEVFDHDPDGDGALLDRLADRAARMWTPGAARAGNDGLWLELGGTAHLWGGEEAFARRLLRFVARLGLAARVAVADTPGAAHALARHRAARLTLCPPGGARAAIAPLPVAALRLEEDALATARRLGVEQVGALLAMPRAPLARRFGVGVLARIDQALGDAGEAIEPVAPVDAPAVRLRLMEPVSTPEAIAQLVTDAVAALVARLEAAGLGARTVRLAAERVDATVQRLAIGTARATRDPVHLGRLFALRIERIEPGFGIEALGLVASHVEPLGAAALDAWPGRAAAEAAALALTADRIGGRIGAGRLYRLGAVESDVPERSVGRVDPLDPAAGWPLHWPRPARLVHPPEPVEGVMALLPDGLPRRFRWRGRMHELVRGDGPERVHGEWWRTRAEMRAVRDYYRVEDRNGARFWLFRRGEGEDPSTADRWYLHGLFA